MSADDEVAIGLEQQLIAEGVRVVPHRIPGGVATVELVLDHNGSLTSTNLSLPATGQSAALIRPGVEQAVTGADGVLVESGLDPRFLRWLRERTARAGIPLCGMPTRSGPLHWFDVLVLNEREAAHALGERPGDQATAAHHAGLLAGTTTASGGAAPPPEARTVVVTRGAWGAVLVDASHPRPLVLPAETQPCLDDTGAGDALAAGFVLHLLRTRDSASALRWGMRAAGVTVRCRRATCRRLRALAPR